MLKGQILDIARCRVSVLPLFGLSVSDVKKMEAKRDVDGLVKALTYKKDARVRDAAAYSLGNICNIPALNALHAALEDQDSDVRESAAKGLVPAYDRVLEIRPQFAEAWSGKGKCLNQLGRFDEAIKCCDKALEINPQLVDAWHNKGVSLNKLGRYVEAIKCCDKALEINPQNANTWGLKGLSLDDLGQYEEAIRSYDRALEINPQNTHIWFFKGIIFERLGRREDEAVCWRRFIELAPAELAHLVEGARNRLHELEGK